MTNQSSAPGTNVKTACTLEDALQQQQQGLAPPGQPSSFGGTTGRGTAFPDRRTQWA